jgi:hypothetical protein
MGESDYVATLWGRLGPAYAQFFSKSWRIIYLPRTTYS